MTVEKSNGRASGHPVSGYSRANGRPTTSEHFKANGKAKPTGKRIGKSKPSKANNQLNRRVK